MPSTKTFRGQINVQRRDFQAVQSFHQARRACKTNSSLSVTIFCSVDDRERSGVLLSNWHRVMGMSCAAIASTTTGYVTWCHQDFVSAVSMYVIAFTKRICFLGPYWLRHYDFESVSFSKKYVNLWLGQCALCHGIVMGSLCQGSLLVIRCWEWSEERGGTASQCHRWGGASSAAGLEQRQAKLSKKSSSSTFLNLSQVFALRHHCKHQLMLDRVNWPGIGEGG